MNDFLDSLIREIEYECYHTCVNRNADRDSDRDSDRDTDEEMPGLVHDLDTDDEMPGLIDDDGYNENSHLMNIYGDFHSYKEYEYDCEETLPDVDSELDEGGEETKLDVVVEETKAHEVQAKADVVVDEVQAKEELVVEDSEAKELKEDIMNLNSPKDVVIEIKELESTLEPTVEPPMEREIKQPTRSFCIIC